jgi:putative transposase
LQAGSALDAAVRIGWNGSWFQYQQAHPQHKLYPYLLRGVDIIRPNQVWSTDITYIRLPRGFVYLVAIIDWYSRKVLAWRPSNTMDAGFSVDCLEEAIKNYGSPEMFNSDQGSHFTSGCFTGVLIDNGALDNIFVERLWRTVKYEEVYLKQHNSVQSLLMGLRQYFLFYNEERWHQSLGYQTPDVVYQSGIGGGAKIVDKYNETGDKSDPEQKDWDSAIQLECEQGSILRLHLKLGDILSVQ